MPSHTEVKLLLLDRTASREVHIHFASALEALQFYEDVEHMRRVTRQLLELQERRRREAELRNAVASPSQQGGETGSLGTATMQQSANAATSASPGAVPSSVGHQASADSGLSPYLGAFYDSNQSPHLSQLGSPRLNSLL